MAFDLRNFQFNRGVITANVQGGGVTSAMHTYKSSTDSKAVITSPNYFPPFVDGDNGKVFINDSLFYIGSDGAALSLFTSVSPVSLGIDLLTSGSSITVGPSQNATDNNGAIISGGILHMEEANSTFGGIITNDNQTFAGTKAFNNGINVFGPGISAQNMSAGGALPINIGTGFTTQLNVLKPLNASGVIVANAGIQIGGVGVANQIGLYQETSGSITWQGPWAANQPGSFIAQRINNTVYLTIAAVPPVAANNVNGITPLSPVVPPTFQPTAATITQPLFITSNSVVAIGNIQIFNNGFIIISADFNSGAFASTGTAGFNNFSCSYSA